MTWRSWRSGSSPRRWSPLAEDLLHEDPLLRVYRIEQPPSLRVVGEVDMSNADRFGRALQASLQDSELVVDLSECEHLGSAGIGAIIELWQHGEGSLRLQLLGPPPTVRYSLEVSGVDRFPGIEIQNAPREGRS